MVKYICYLCGKKIKPGKLDFDHVIQQQFMERPQPKMKGFDYAGKIPTHKNCNNRFGAEKRRIKTLKLLSVLFDPECCIVRRHQTQPIILIGA